MYLIRTHEIARCPSRNLNTIPDVMVDHTSANNDFLNRVIHSLNQHLSDEDFGVSELARNLGMSRSQLHRRLRKLEKKTASRFIREYRLTQARKLLKQEKFTVSEVAYRVGFRNPTYFHSSFRNMYGHTPGTTAHDDVALPTLRSGENVSFSSTAKGIIPLSIYGGGGLLMLIVFLFLVALGRVPENLSPSANTTRGFAFEDIKGPDVPVVREIRNALVPDLTKLLQDKEWTKTDLSSAQDPLLQAYLVPSADSISFQLYLTDSEAGQGAPIAQVSVAEKKNGRSRPPNKLASGILAGLTERLPSREVYTREEAIKNRGTDAQRHYLQGEFLRLKNQPDAHKEAIDHYQQAIGGDSTFLEAYIGLANTYLQCGTYWGESEARNAWEKAEAVLLMARKHIPGHPVLEEKLHMGYFTYERDLPRAERFYLNQQHSGNTSYLRSVQALEYALQTGRIRETLLRINRNLEVNASQPRQYLLLAKALLLQGKTNEARQILETYSSFFTDNYYYLMECSRLYLKLEDYTEARSYLDRFEKRFRERPPVVLWINAILLESEGKYEEAGRYVRELEWRVKAATAGSPAWFLAIYYARKENLEVALQWLIQSYTSGEAEMTWMRQEPWLDPLREENRFRELYTSMGFPVLD